MTSLLGKIGIDAEKVYNVTTYPIAWTQSFYGWTTDKLVLPFVSHVALPSLSYLADRTVVPLVNRIRASASEPLDPEVEPPRRPKRCGKCFDLKDLYNLCKWIKKHTHYVAHMQPTKIPDPEGLDRFDQFRNDVCVKGEKAVIQGFRIIYVVAEIGEKPIAVRLYLTEMGKELRPSLMAYVVEPICKDIKGVVAGYIPSDLASGAGDFFEKESVALIDQHLKEKEEHIAQSLTKIEEQAQDQAIILRSKVSNYMLREGVYLFVTPWLVSFITPHVVSSIGNYTGYVETVNTVAYLLSYLKYAAWAKTAYIGAKKLYESYSPEFSDLVRNQLYGSFSGTTNPTEELRKYPDVVTTHYELPSLTQKFNVKIIELVPPLGVYIKASDSETLKKLQEYSGNLLRALKAKSDRTLRKYDLIDDSPRVEEVIEEKPLDLPEAARVPSSPSLLPTGTSPKASEVSDRAPSILGTVGKTAELAKDALALVRSEKKEEPVSGAPAPESEKEKKSVPSPSFVALVDKAVEVTEDVAALVGDGKTHSSDAPPPSSPEPSVSPDPSLLFSPKKPKKPRTDRDPLITTARTVAKLLDKFTSTAATPPPPETIPAAAEPADGAREEPKESPSAQPNWIRRAAVVMIVAGATLVIGIKILNRFSLMPASLSKFSLPTNLEDSNAMKFLSSIAKLLFHLFKSSREQQQP